MSNIFSLHTDFLKVAQSGAIALLHNFVILSMRNSYRSDQDYPVWSSYDAVEAANTMLKVLKTAKNQDNA